MPTASRACSPNSGLYSATKERVPSESASSAAWVPSMVAILTSSPGVRPASWTACAAPRPISSFWAKTSWTSLPLDFRTVSKTLLASSVDQFAVWEPRSVKADSPSIAWAQPSLRSLTTETPAGPSSTKYFAPSGKVDFAHSATEVETATLSGARRVA